MRLTCGAIASMARARLVRTLARSAATWGVTAPLTTQLVPMPMPAPRAWTSSYSRQRAKSMSSAPSCSRANRAGCRARSAAASSSPRLRACCGGHCPSRAVLSEASATAPLMASWSPVNVQLVARMVMVSPRARATSLG